jgi:hypothetical protein
MTNVELHGGQYMGEMLENINPPERQRQFAARPSRNARHGTR